jgi:uncharacterized protein (UPF0261 family)
MKKNIVLVATLDTKGPESLYVKKLIEKKGHKVISIDMGTGARGELLYPPDYPREEVVKAVGSSMEEIDSLGKTGQENRIIDIMAEGTIKICHELYDLGKMQGVISLGGVMGTSLGTRVMRALPFGLPKVMLSTLASGDVRRYVGTKDIVMLPSIADIAGLNRITETTLTQAAGTVVGLVSMGKVKGSNRPLIGITTLGGTTTCALQAKKQLEAKGYEVVIFHANGMGGRAMEEMIEQNLIQAVFDLSPNEVVDHIYQGLGDAGPMRLVEAGKKGIPLLLAPGNIDHIQYSSLENIPERFKHQYVHVHGPGINVLRTKKNEMIEVAKFMADKMNNATGKVTVIFPSRGLSVLDRVDKEFDDIEANYAWLDTMKQCLKPGIEVREVDAHATDISFGDVGAEMLYKMMEGS